MAGDAERVPPHSIEAERAVIGAILLEPNVIGDLGDLDSKAFYKSAHRVAFEACRSLWIDSHKLDLVLLKDFLKATNSLEAVGGINYLAAMLEECPTSANAANYAEIIRKKWRDRKLIAACHETASCMWQQKDQDEAISKLQSVIMESDRGNADRTASILSMVMKRHDELADLSREPRSNFSPTGIPGLDNLLTGFCKTDLIIVAGRPSCGKTAFAVQCCIEAAINGPVGFGSVEMSKEALTNRALAYQSGVEHRLIREERLGQSDLDRIREASAYLGNLPMLVDDDSSMSPSSLWALGRRARRKYGDLSLLAVDYLQIMKPDYQDKKAKRHEIIGGISRSLKAMGKQLNVPILALCQLSRKIEDRSGAWSRPRLSDLRESGDIEQDADVVIFLHSKEENPHKDVIEVIVTVGKQRNGPIGDLKVMFNKRRQRFFPPEWHYQERADWK